MKRFLGGSTLILLWPLISLAQSAPFLTPESLRAALKVKPTGTRSEQLAEEIRQYFGGKESLQKGPPPNVEGMLAAWAIEVSGVNAAPRIVSDDGRKVVKLASVGSTGVYAAVAAFPDQTVQLFHYEVGGKRIASVPLEAYKPDPDSLEKPGVPRGKVTEIPAWRSRIFEDTTREWWLYVPAQYKPKAPACVMVFQDGKSYKDFVPVVFDNLIAKGEMPVTAGIFVAPGVFKDGRPDRSFEYDTLSDQYARFILEEVLPEVEKTVKLRQDCGQPSHRRH
jgi:hypothetical protein